MFRLVGVIAIVLIRQIESRCRRRRERNTRDGVLVGRSTVSIIGEIGLTLLFEKDLISRLLLFLDSIQCLFGSIRRGFDCFIRNADQKL